MKFKVFIAAALAVALSCGQANAQATILPPGKVCFQANAGVNGMIGLLGTITPGSGGTSGTFGGVALTGGSGSGATANVVVSGGVVTSVTVLNPGTQYVTGDVLSAVSGNIGGVTGFSVPVSSTAINSSLAGGSVGFFIPNTLSVKQTWKNSGETILNSNPVVLDQNGCALIYGSGSYRQIVQDSLGNTVWDAVTSSTGPASIFWAGLATGTGNAIAITDSSFANQDGAMIAFLAKAANSGPTTISVSGGAAIAVVNDLSAGPSALSGGEIGPGNTPVLLYDATNVQFHIVNPSASSSGSGSSGNITPPQGYLNLVGQATGNVVQTGDVISVSTIFYSPFIGNTIPIWNGSVFKQTVFSELTATLTAAGSPISAIQDECVFSNNGVPTLVTSPAWTTATAGAGNRGTGAGTPQLTRLQGIWVNAVTMIGYNGLSSFTIPANQCTYVGSLSIDGTAGQVSAYRTSGQSRKFGVWNAYNRVTIEVLAGDPAASWVSAPTTWRQSNAGPTNFIMGFSGLAEEEIEISFGQNIQNTAPAGNTSSANIGIGINSTTVPNGMIGIASAGLTGGTISVTITTAKASTVLAPTLGINQFNMLEQAPSGTTNNQFDGTSANMQMLARWRG